MSEKFIHEEIRREMDNYINHAKSKGIKIEHYGSLEGYCHLLNEIVSIEYINKKIENGDKL